MQWFNIVSYLCGLSSTIWPTKIVILVSLVGNWMEVFIFYTLECLALPLAFKLVENRQTSLLKSGSPSPCKEHLLRTIICCPLKKSLCYLHSHGCVCLFDYDMIPWCLQIIDHIRVYDTIIICLNFERDKKMYNILIDPLKLIILIRGSSEFLHRWRVFLTFKMV